MTICFSSAPFGKPGSDDFRQIGVLTQQPNGRYTCQWGPTNGKGEAPDNPPTILGVSPDGGYSAGPANAIGNGQQFHFSDGCLSIRPNISINDGSVLIPGAPTIAYIIAARALD